MPIDGGKYAEKIKQERIAATAEKIGDVEMTITSINQQEEVVCNKH